MCRYFSWEYITVFFDVIYNDEAEALLHQRGRHTWLENGLVIDSNLLPPYLLFSLVLQWNIITTTEEGRKWKRYSERFQTVNKVYQLPLVSPSVYVASPCFSFTLTENVSPVFACASVFGRPCSPDLSWNHDVHFTQEALLYHRSVLVCQLSARKKRTGNFFAGRGAGEGGKPFAQNIVASVPNFYKRVEKKRGLYCNNIGRTGIWRWLDTVFSGSMPSLSINYVAINKH